MAIAKASFIVNESKPEALPLVKELRRTLEARGVAIQCEERIGRALGLPTCVPGALGDSDLCIVLGGDGTLIHAAHVLAGRPVPILGVNLGSLGFMTEVPRTDIHRMLDRVLEGDFQVEPRMLLRVQLFRGANGGQKLLEDQVLNEVVVNKGALARMSDIEVAINGAYVTTYKADGVIVSTPTGSTAYSLAAAGPIVYPTMKAVILTPICPHTLTQRPIVIPEDRTITLGLRSQSAEMYVTLDGKTGLPMLPGDRVQVQQSPDRLLLIKNPAVDFFSILRAKLRWGER